MTPSYRMLVAVAVVCVLAVVSRTPSAHSSTPVPTPGTTDRDVLVTFYHATGGDNWTYNDNWLSDAPINTWLGVITDENGRVFMLALSENRLRGTLPPELGTLTSLRGLYLWGNELSGTIPAELGNLANLVELSLSSNLLNGRIPPELGNLPNLAGLHLWGNQLSGPIPSELGNLSSLTELDLSSNQLIGPIPPELGNLSSLKLLHLGGNKLIGTIPPALGNLANLAQLYLGNNKLVGAIPPELKGLASLEELSLFFNQLEGEIPSELGNLTNLTRLDLGGNQLNGMIPIQLGNLTSLEKLYLAENQLHGPIPSELGNLSNLEEMGLWNNQLSGTIPSELSTLSSLEGLVLSENRLIGTIPPELSKLSNLKGLDLSKNQLIGTIPPELGKLFNLELLYLQANRLSGAIPSELGNLTSLIEMNLSLNQLSGGIPSQLDNLSNLTGLALRGNQLNGMIPSELGNLRNLEILFLAENRLSGAIPLELGTLNNLTYIYLSANLLSGCVPELWRNLEGSDLEDLSLPFCTDRDVLVALFQATAGTGWANRDNWLSDAPIGTWYGVTTDENGRVTELDLSENGLRGTIPTALGMLTYLETLALAHNLLSGSIPLQLGNLNNLQTLVLSENQLIGTIPPQLGNLKNLIVLGINSNQLNGAVPRELGNLDNLQTLALWDNQLNGTVPSVLGNLINLKTLFLSGNQLSGPIPPELGYLVNLENLFLSENQLSGPIPPELGNLSNLKTLFLNSNQLSGTIPPQLGNLTNLTGLSLWDNRLIGAIPRELGQLIHLTGLGLSENKLSGTIPPELSNLSNLGQLYIRDNQLTGCLPAPWKNVAKNDFDELDLPFCTVSPSPVVPQTLSTDQIFSMVSPAIAFVHTEIGAGSGVLIEGNYVLTNAHVVWPYHAASIVFPDGSAFDQVPLKGWDLLADVALLGPIIPAAQPLTLRDGENIPIGSDLYLIGYPGEVEAYPQPAIARGILSRLRQWKPAAVTYFQIDASIAGGQSGGALVSNTGDVIGISGFKIAEGQFALVASAADLLPRIRQLLAGEDPSGLGERRLPLEGGSLRHVLTSERYWDAYVVDEPAGSAIEVALSGAGDSTFRIFDPFGNEITYTETASFDFVTQSSGPHFLVFSQLSDETTTLTANHRFVRFVDPDQGREILVGQSLPGNIDFPGDVDFFFLYLENDEAVEVAARSALTDPYLGIVGLRSSEEELIGDDNSGGGLFGLDARILFQAPYTGEYVLIVFDALGIAPGGYVISVARPQSMDVPTSQIPVVTIKTHMNVRQGPGTNYPIIDTAAPGEQYVITGKNSGPGDWWQIDYKGRTAWVYAPLVTATDAENVQVVATPDP